MSGIGTVEIVHCHAAGEVGDVVIGGVEPPPGNTIWAQSRHIAEDGKLRNFLLNEPRGGVFRHVNLLVPPVNPEAQAAFIIMEPADTPPMSGSNAVCVAKVVLETGLVAMSEPQTELVLEAPGGLVRVSAACHDGRVQRIRIENLPSFADKTGQKLKAGALGVLDVDTAYGGDSFVIVSTNQLPLAIEPANARQLADLGMVITQAANEQIGFRHPEITDLNHISFCMFADPVSCEQGRLSTRHAVAVRPGKIDRSPTGTGISARMALLHAQGKMKVGDSLCARSIIGSEFVGRIEAAASVAGRDAIRPSIAGSAFITGTSRLRIDPDDPWPEGYRLNDTWPGAA
jgi:trans-L-3-hydroxyproline dehydratase